MSFFFSFACFTVHVLNFSNSIQFKIILYLSFLRFIFTCFVCSDLLYLWKKNAVVGFNSKYREHAILLFFHIYFHVFFIHEFLSWLQLCVSMCLWIFLFIYFLFVHLINITKYTKRLNGNGDDDGKHWILFIIIIFAFIFRRQNTLHVECSFFFILSMFLWRTCFSYTLSSNQVLNLISTFDTLIIRNKQMQFIWLNRSFYRFYKSLSRYIMPRYKFFMCCEK